MTSAALTEAKGWYAALMDAEFKGRGDREKAVRGRIADETGIPESYLYRLQYKTRGMKDVAGSAYRALILQQGDARAGGVRMNLHAVEHQHDIETSRAEVYAVEIATGVPLPDEQFDRAVMLDVERRPPRVNSRRRAA